jgi:hypothetical protein
MAASSGYCAKESSRARATVTPDRYYLSGNCALSRGARLWSPEEASIMTLTAHTAVLIDAAATAGTAVLMIAARGVLYPYFGLSSPLLLDLTAAVFLVYAAIIALAAKAPTIARATLMTIVGANVAYVLASMVLLVTYWASMHAVGRTLMVIVAVVVEAFAMLQFAAARKSRDRLAAA